MASSDPSTGAVLLASLALGPQSSARLDARRADAIVRCLRRHPNQSPSEALRREGFWQEAVRCESAGLDRGHGSPEWQRLASLLAEGKVLTRACPSYPAAWLDPPAGSSHGPVALHVRERWPERHGRWIAVVGSRAPVSSMSGALGWDAIRWAEESARQLVSHPDGLGSEGTAADRFSVVSGGAPGVDHAALQGAATADPVRALALLPAGLDSGFYRGPAGKASDAPPLAPFSAKAAMARNAWLVSLAEAIIVADLRWGQGGTFQTVQMAFRARKPILCRFAPEHPSLNRLASAGAHAVRDPVGPSDILEAGRRFEERWRRVQPALTGV